MAKRLIFLYFLLFPFGQIIRIGIIHPIEVVVGLFSFLTVIRLKKEDLRDFKGFTIFTSILLFSLIFSLSFFKLNEILLGGAYLLRLVAYLLFFIGLTKLVKRKGERALMTNSLIVVGTFVAIFGLFQYLFYPDLRALYAYGWDDHYYRLVSTFLDPAFTGIILVLTFLLVFLKFLKTKRRIFFPLLLVLFLSLGLTYSRSSFLALLAGVAVISYFVKNFKIFLLFLVGLIVLILVLPRPGGEGVKLTRTYSIYEKIESYQEGLTLFKKSPLFGIGFNNVCVAKNKFIRFNPPSHACSGLDNSLIFILATTGVVGFFAFLSIALEMWGRIDVKSFYGQVLIVSGVAVLVHSLFTNTLFYPWVMGWLAILLATAQKTKGNRKQ